MKLQTELVKETIKSWILELDCCEKLPDGITALNFGLFEPYGIELIGSIEYDPEDDDWACEEDYVPEQRTCEDLHIPSSIGWETVLDCIVSILKELVAELTDVNLFKVEHITTGFCDGDLAVIK